MSHFLTAAGLIPGSHSASFPAPVAEEEKLVGVYLQYFFPD